jgi:hypothetical protein
VIRAWFVRQLVAHPVHQTNTRPDHLVENLAVRRTRMRSRRRDLLFTLHRGADWRVREASFRDVAARRRAALHRPSTGILRNPTTVVVVAQPTDACDAEVTDRRFTMVDQDDVHGLDVAVDDAALMRGTERSRAPPQRSAPSGPAVFAASRAASKRLVRLPTPPL